jgi:mono/diheme cytochrome c family protein
VKNIYDKKCASCHGKDGKGKPSLVKMFKTELSLLDLIDKETLDKTDDDLVLITSKGIKNKMPAFRAELKEEEIKDVITYIRSLSK